MAISKKRKSQLSKIGGRALANLIRFVGKTSTIVTEPPELLAHVHADAPSIIACWHGQFMMMAHFHRDMYPVAAMVARHGDAELIGHAVESFGAELIRGAGAGLRKKNRGGAYALRASVTALNEGKSIVMTADVPPGPARCAGDGIIRLAMHSGRPIVPVAAATTRYHAFKTWSRLTINLPFSTLSYVAGDHIYIPPNATEEQLEAARQHLEVTLNHVTARAYELAKADPARATPPDPDAPLGPPPQPGFGLNTYRAATRVLEPIAPVVLRARESKGKEDPTRRNERLGAPMLERPQGRLAWFHAASVGESNAILPVISRLHQLDPNLNFLLTTGTVTSAATVKDRLGPNTVHQFAPIDGPSAATKFLRHWKPDIGVFTESDIWPNLVLEASARQIPLVLVNARLSNKSYGRWRKNKRFAEPLFSRFNAILAQDEKLARRFSEIGGRNVTCVGNLKIDAPPLHVDQQALDQLRTAIGTRPFYVAASTHDGEEAIVAQAHRTLARQFPGFLTLLAPRHPERGTAIAEQMKSDGLNVAQRSLGQLPAQNTDVYIVDTLGELGTLYAASPIAFIGGSLIDKGGQNPIEAIMLDTAVIAGQHTNNHREIYQTLNRLGGSGTANNAPELAEAVAYLMTDLGLRSQVNNQARNAVTTLSGALERTVQTILAHIPPGPPTQAQPNEQPPPLNQSAHQPEGHARASG